MVRWYVIVTYLLAAGAHLHDYFLIPPEQWTLIAQHRALVPLI